MAGYSGTPLLKKLGIKEGCSMLVINKPKNYSELIGELHDEAREVNSNSKEIDFIHVFVKSKKELESSLPKLMNQLKRDGMIWVSWYKKSAGIPTDVTEDVIRSIALPMGLVDVKVCAVDEQWSGLKLVIRKENRIK
jgi:hypothetical protein